MLPTLLQTAPLHVAPGTAEAAGEHIALLMPRLRPLKEQRTRCGRRIDGLLSQLEGSDPAGLAEAGRALAERDYYALRSQAGTAPVTQKSGKRGVVIMRLGCNRRLRNAFYHWGRVGMQCDLRARAHYDQLRQRGHSHGRALRGVVDRLLAMLIAMLKAGALYDPRRRQACAAVLEKWA